MRIEKLAEPTDKVVPVIAALPYRISMDEESDLDPVTYDPATQRTIFAGGRNFSTSREDDSASYGFMNLKSKSDTKKDD